MSLEKRRLEEMLQHINPDSSNYISRGRNIGWTKKSGEIGVNVTDADDLLQKLTPRGSWSLTATLNEEQNSITLELRHHDSLTGETHTLFASD